MNDSYPTSTADYDHTFLKLFLRNVFERSDLKECARTGNVRGLNSEKYQFVKCKFMIDIISNYFNCIEFLLILIFFY